MAPSCWSAPIPTTPIATINNNHHLPRPFFFPFSIKHHPLRPPRLPPRPTPLISTTATSSTHLQSPEDPINPTCGQQPKRHARRLKTHEPDKEQEQGAKLTPQWFQFLHLAIRQRDLRHGKVLHAVFTRIHLEEHDGEDTHLLTMLISLYGKVGHLACARKVFEQMPVKDVVAYSTLITSYAKSGHQEEKEEAIGLFFRMRASNIEPNHYAYVAVLSACAASSNFKLGSALHALVVKTNHFADVYVGNALMALFIKDRRLDNAVGVFKNMPHRDVTSWNTIMSGMVKESRYLEVLGWFRDMGMHGFVVDGFTLSTLLTTCEKGFLIDEGRAVHAHSIKVGLELGVSVANALISFYTEFGLVDDVVYIFERMPTRDVISWTGMLNGYMKFGNIELAVEVFKQIPSKNSIVYNSLLAGFCRNGDAGGAMDIFRIMVRAGVELSDHTMSSVINACALKSDMEKSRQMHGFAIKFGCESNPWVKAALLDMCMKCNRVEDAKKMLNRWPREKDYLIAWTSMVSGYLQNGQPDEGLSLFYEVVQEEGLASVDEVALSTVLEICGTLGFVGIGKQMHCHAIKSGGILDVAVGNAILSMYSECGYMDDALKNFNSMAVRDIISWNALLMAHLAHRQGDDALSVLKKMEMMGVYPDELSFLFIISACKYSSSDPVGTCRRLFASMTKCYGIRPSEEHYASLIKVFCQWDLFHEAEELIKDMPIKAGAVVWRALLNGCRLRSNLTLEKRAMQQILALKPDNPSTFVLISNIYSSSGRWHCSETSREVMQEMGVRKRPAQSWIVLENKRHTFYSRDRSHPHQRDIYAALKVLILECMRAGYVPDTSFVLHEVEEYQKKDFLFFHSAKLAVAYGILIASPGKPIWAVKNIRLCGDCHSFFKHVSLVTGREIILRDATGFHNFKSGKCTCGDYW